MTTTAELLLPPTVVPPRAPLPLGRFVLAFVRNPLRSLPQPVYEAPLVLNTQAKPPLVWVTDPALVETILLHEADRFPKTPLEKRVLGPSLGDGLLTAQGASWRWQRKLAAPLFRHGDLLSHLPSMTSAADGQVARWRDAGRHGSFKTDVERDMSATTYEVISRTILAGGDPRDHAAVREGAHAVLTPISWEIAAAMLRLPGWVWHPGKSRLRRGAVQLREATHRIVAARRRETDPGSDLLARLLAARNPDTGAPMSDEQIVDNVLTFLTAGHETTAKALTWTLYLLARSPQWQARVHREVVEVAGEAAITAEHLGRLAVTQRVLKESLRLYPPAPVMTREAGEDVVLGGCPIPAGTLIVIPVFAVHRHRTLWRDPDRFDPDRFLPEREAGHVRTQFMPFGFGPRICIGQSFAMIEATAILATLVRAIRFEWDGLHRPEPLSRITLRPKGGMPLILVPR